MVPAVILAAGASRRMGSPKAVLADPAGIPFIVRICNTLVEAGVHDIVVVTGVDHDRIEEVIGATAGCEVRLVRNPAPERGQLSSLQAGLAAAISENVQAVLVTLVDVPLIAPGTVRAVIEAWRRSGAPIVRPVVGERHGHPVIFDRRLFDELWSAPLEIGAKHVFRTHTAEVVDVPVADHGCVVDIDTPAEYARVMGRDGAG